jgi:hypothetical protein
MTTIVQLGEQSGDAVEGVPALVWGLGILGLLLALLVATLIFGKGRPHA